MSEKLEEKYKYMCKLVEQMASSLHKAGDIIEANEDMSRDLFELKKKEELLLDHIYGMCEMIYYQVPLNEQDSWMETMIEQGYYKKPEDDE